MDPKILNSKILKSFIKSTFRNANYRKLHSKVPVKEIMIPVKWGHVAAKLWGNENERPILALHGHLDNAGTWDTLAPSLCKKRPILAIDVPGHGLSSWIPQGLQYNTWQIPQLILYIKEYFKWEKVSILGHSMGSIAGIRFAGTFPDYVDLCIAIENLVYNDYDVNSLIEYYAKIMKKLQTFETKEYQPRCYNLEEMINAWHLITEKSVLMENIKHLLKRGAKPSTQVPHKYCFNSDPRLTSLWFAAENKCFLECLIKKIKCPTLYVKGSDSRYNIDEFCVKMRETFVKNNENFEYHCLPGTHHVHLNNPELVEPIILNFFQKHKI